MSNFKLLRKIKFANFIKAKITNNLRLEIVWKNMENAAKLS